MATLIISFYLFSRPLTSFARQTQKFCLRDLRRQKPQSLRDTINACAWKAWSFCLGRSPRQKVFIVCACLRLKYLLIYQIQRGSSAHSIKFHQLFRRWSSLNNWTWKKKRASLFWLALFIGSPRSSLLFIIIYSGYSWTEDAKLFKKIETEAFLLQCSADTINGVVPLTGDWVIWWKAEKLWIQ